MLKSSATSNAWDFQIKGQSQYNLRHNSLFSRSLVKSVYKGTENLSFLVPKFRDILPNTYKDILDLNSFKVALKKLRPVNCACRIFRVYIPNDGFV